MPVVSRLLRGNGRRCGDQVRILQVGTMRVLLEYRVQVACSYREKISHGRGGWIERVLLGLIS